MKKYILSLILIVSLAILFSSCAPAAGRAPAKYQASSGDIINAIAEIAITMQPSSSYNFFSINTINDRFVTIQANTTTGISILTGGGHITINWTALESNGTVTLAANGRGSSGTVNDVIDRILTQLDGRFTRIR